ncbi:MAG: CheR family methyltransferase [Candidatus Omnitrophota bacterium]
MKDILPISNKDFDLFQKLLIEESGICIDSSRSQSLSLALRQRLKSRSYGSHREYYNLLKFHPEGWLEVRELIDLITIGETYFFRNKPHFDALVNIILPEIISRKVSLNDFSLRIWSAGCSRGDEAYSIAIAITEKLVNLSGWHISILGTDINRDARAAASEGIYGLKDVSRMRHDYIEKYFVKRGADFILDRRIKELVNFQYHNLAKDEFSQPAMQNLDIIFCRNVIIYFDLETTRRVIDKFYSCLSQDGYLFLGHAETLWQISGKFKAIEFPQTFIYKKALGEIAPDVFKAFLNVPEKEAEEIFLSESGLFFEAVKEDKGPVTQEDAGSYVCEKEPSENILVSGGVKLPLEVMYKQALELFKDKLYEEALALCDEIIGRDKNHNRAFLCKATILANQGRYDEAISQLGGIINKDSLDLGAYYLLGVLFGKTGDLSNAENQFKKAIYIDPACELAYYNLGNIYLSQDKFSSARREFSNALKLLNKRTRGDEEIKFSEDFTVEYLRRACEKSIVQIEALAH